MLPLASLQGEWPAGHLAYFSKDTIDVLEL